MNDPLFVRLKSQLLDLKSPIDFDSLHSYLTEKQGSEYDNILLSQLFAKLNKDIDEDVTVDEFLESLIDSEHMIRQRLQELDEEVEESTAKVQRNGELAEKSRSTEQFNQFGISLESELTVRIDSLTLQIPASVVHVTIEAEGQFRQTKAKSGDLKFNETHKLKVTNGGDNIVIAVFQAPDQLIGELFVPFGDLKTQQPVEQTYNLLNPARERVGKIKLRLLWIWNYALYYEGQAAYWKDMKVQAAKDSQLLGSQLTKLMLPFQLGLQSMSSIEPKSPLEDNEAAGLQLELGDLSEISEPYTKNDDRESPKGGILDDDSSFKRAESFGRLSFDSGQDEDLKFSDFKAYLDDKDKPSMPQDKLPENAVKAETSPGQGQSAIASYEPSDTGQGLPIGLLYFILATSLLSAFSRPDFLNVSVRQFSLILAFLAKAELKASLKVLTATLVASQFLDVLWFISYTYESDAPDQRIQEACYWTAMAGFLGKLGLLKYLKG